MQRIGLYILLLLLSSCTANKYLNEGERFFEGHEITYVDPTNQLPNDLKNGLYEILKPDASRRFLWSRPGIWIYYNVKDPEKEKGFKYWLKYKLGTKPVLMSQTSEASGADAINTELNVNGFFNNSVKTEVDTSKHSAKIVYKVKLNQGYTIDSIEFCQDPQAICSRIEALHSKSDHLVSGDLFRKRNLEAERKYLAADFQNSGYFYFSPSFIYFQADSNDGSATLDIKIQPKEIIPQIALQKYTIASSTVDLSSGSPNAQTLGDSLNVIIDPERLFLKPAALKPFFEIKPGTYYSKKDEKLTLDQLSKLEVFEFINIRYDVDTVGGQRLLHASVMANPRKKHSLRAEFNLSTTSTNFTGPGLQFEYYNRNVFRGAEKFRFTATTRYEQQLSGSNKGIAAYEIDLNANLLIPKVSLPFISKSVKGNVPKTKYRLQYRLYNQPEYYAQSTFGVGFGYEWLTNKSFYNDLRIFNFDFLKLLSSSERLEQLIQDNILTPESFEDQVIAGVSYAASYSPQTKTGQRLRHFIGGSFELAGNALNGIYELTNASRDENGQYAMFNVPFAQYARLQTDLRAYYKYSKYHDLAVRQIISVGLPYGNSESLPFAKQFFVGGASSLRAFQPRSIGPGSYKNTSEDDNSFFDQTGDIQIEYNIEDRFDLGGYLEGAVFIDVGNVWLMNESENRPGGAFNWNRFLDEMAVSAGFGLRLNFDFLLVRFDLAAPLRLPYLPEGDRWVVDKISIDKNWRRDNLVLNFAIGYPF